MKYILPFPASILRPNDKSHWAKKNPAKNKLKQDWFMVGLANKLAYKEGNITLYMVFYPPNNRWDWDGMASAIKSGLDGLALAWNVNDKLFRPVTIDPQPADKKNPRVELHVVSTHKVL